MKLIACIPLKNEAWVLRYTLSALSEFVDEIIALDDGSDDDSIEVLEGFPKVSLIIKKDKHDDNQRNEPKDWNRLTKAALKRGADWILFTDADEMLEPKIKTEINAMMNDESVGVYQFAKISPWRGFEFYRADNNKWVPEPKNVLNPILIRSSRKIKWGNPKGSLFKRIAKFLARGDRFMPIFGRQFPLGIEGKIVSCENLMSVHFNNLNYFELIKKQMFYILNEKRERPYKKNLDLVNWACFRLDETNIKLLPVNQDWYWKDYLKEIEL